MGVPKFFRWISERYPKINQRVAMEPSQETIDQHFEINDKQKNVPEPLFQPDPLSTCGLKPPIDRLYIDMNGILHGASHNNSGQEDVDVEEQQDQETVDNNVISHDEIFRNVCYYLDRIVGDMVEPTELVYMAIDGVAPRAKLNQQRSRRYRSGQAEGEIERTVYEAHLHAQQAQVQEIQYHAHPEQQQQQQQQDEVYYLGDAVQEVEPGRFTGKFTTHEAGSTSSTTSDIASSTDLQQQQQQQENASFHSNSITPGTRFFAECTARLQQFVQHKLSTDPKWQHLTIIFSGPNVPGEGEHKIMDFMRNQKALDDYNPNTRHCIMGQDGDLIMLGLATHEPNLVLLREQVVFDVRRKLQATRNASLQDSLSRYIHNRAFEFLHMQILRDYLAYEFETSNVVPGSPFQLERTVDDFVFLTFFVGNDFLPHMPALDIGDEAFDLLFYTYKQQRTKWLQQKKDNGGTVPYLTHAGNIVSGSRLEEFFTALGSHETNYYDNKKQWAGTRREKWRAQDVQANRKPTVPPDEVIRSKEEADRAEYKKMLQSITVDTTNNNNNDDDDGIAAATEFDPVVSDHLQVSNKAFCPEENVVEAGLLTRLSSLLRYSVSLEDATAEKQQMSAPVVHGNEEDLKGRYYFGKFGFTPYDAEKHIALRKAYIEGLVWNLKYYYEGCVSWDWYYPYHYGPMLSDLVNIDEMLEEISFDEPGEPLRPYEQLMGCLPPSSAHLLPEPYHWLLQDEKSPIRDFYPSTFTVDMNGKRWPWEAVVLLPFIDSKRLIDAARTLVPERALSQEERERNSVGKALVFTHDSQHATRSVPGVGQGKNFGAIEECTVKSEPLEFTKWNERPKETAVFRPELSKGVIVAQPGFPTLQEAPIQSLVRRRIGINVFGRKSRYVTALLEMADIKPFFPPVSVLGPEFVGTTVFVGYPYLSEGFVTAVSDSEMTVRGKEPVRLWTRDERQKWLLTRNTVSKKCTHGEGLTGSGGWKVPTSDKTFSVRPLQRIETLPDGSSVKVFAKFEIEVPIDAALISPSRPDPRLVNIPARLEKDPFFLEVSRKDGGKGEVLPAAVNGRPTAAVDVTPPQHEMKEYSAVLPPRDGEMDVLPPTIDLRQVAPKGPPLQESAAAVSLTSDAAPLVSRPLGSNALVRKPLPRAGGRRNHFRKARTLSAGVRKYGTARTVLPSLQTRNNATTPAGRLLAVGAAAAAVAFFANGANGQVVASLMSKGVVVPRLLELRGGDQEAHDPFGIQHDMDSVAPPPLEFAHGTTTLSFIFQGGIVAAVDSRASLGNFVGSKTTQKVLPINDFVLGTMAGGAADCMHWIRKLTAQAKLHELTEGRRMSVARASRLLSNTLYQLRGHDLSVGTMIMGVDPDGGCSIYYVDNTGVRIGGDLFSVGSGSTFALGILDTERRYDMTEEEAIALGIKAIRHATFRDAFSGGFINVYLITREGWKKVFSEDLALSAERMRKEIESV